MVRLLRISAGSPSIGDEGDKQLHNHIFRLIGQRLEHAERRIADFALIPSRLERLLADFSAPQHSRVLIDNPLTRPEIASIVGSTRESVTVRLNAMRRAGTIRFR
jgi:CRP-like cAMP-binding protein